jgi:hypothetical protein
MDSNTIKMLVVENKLIDRKKVSNRFIRQQHETFDNLDSRNVYHQHIQSIQSSDKQKLDKLQGLRNKIMTPRGGKLPKLTYNPISLQSQSKKRSPRGKRRLNPLTTRRSVKIYQDAADEFLTLRQ